MRPNPPRSKAPTAGGCLLALGLIGGAVAAALAGLIVLIDLRR